MSDLEALRYELSTNKNRHKADLEALISELEQARADLTATDDEVVRLKGQLIAAEERAEKAEKQCGKTCVSRETLMATESERDAALERERVKDAATPDDLRAQGWMVGIHNDYRQDGKLYTFWLFTHPNGRYIKGEGATDAEALDECRAALSTPAPTPDLIAESYRRLLATAEQYPENTGIALGLLLAHVGQTAGDNAGAQLAAIRLVDKGVRASVEARPATTPREDTGAAFSLVDYLSKQREWSSRTFGIGRRTGGILEHIDKEQDEVRSDPDDAREWIDIAILALDGAWRTGWTPEQIVEGLAAKQRINFQRTYPMPESDDHCSEHVRAAHQGKGE